MFQFSGFTSLRINGLPHSDIFGSTPACGYPKLFAACHVLHRLRMPRHPPYTLIVFLPKSLLMSLSLFLRKNFDSSLICIPSSLQIALASRRNLLSRGSMGMPLSCCSSVSLAQSKILESNQVSYPPSGLFDTVFHSGKNLAFMRQPQDQLLIPRLTSWRITDSNR
jgi:hypothetical protein